MAVRFASVRPQGAAVAAALACAAVTAATAINGATQHGPALVLRGLAVGYAVTLWPTLRRAVPRWDLAVPALVWLTLSAATLAAPSPGFALQAWITTTAIVVLFAALLAAENDATPALLRLAVAIGLGHAAWACGQWLVQRQRAAGGFFSPNDLAAFLAPLLVLAAARARGGDARRWGAAVAVLGLGLVASGSRSGLLAAALGLVPVLSVDVAARLRGGPTLRRRLAIAITAAALGLGAAGLAGSRWSRWGDAYAYSRLAIWKRSVEVALDHPSGVGLAGYADALRVAGIPLEGWVRYPKTAQHAHSEPLNAWVELGFLGLAAALAPPLVVLLAIRRRSPAGSRQRAADLGVWLALALPASLSASLHVPPVAFLAAVWAAGVMRREPAGEVPGALALGPAQRPVVLGLATLVIAAALPGVVSTAAMERAATRRDAGDVDAALAWAELAASAAPWSVGAALLRESLVHARGRPARESAAALAELAAAFPDDPGPPRRAAWLLEATAAKDPDAGELWAAAVAARRDTVARDPLAVVDWVALARDAQRAGDAALARSALDQALSVEPHCGEALAAAAQLARASGDAASAKDLARRAWAAHQQAPQESDYAARVLSLEPGSERMLLASGLLAP